MTITSLLINNAVNRYTGPAVQAHDFKLDDKFNTVLVTVTNSSFPIIPDMTPEDRQSRAESDEPSTTELPIFVLDNSSTSDKIQEWNRTSVSPFRQFAVKRTDFRVAVSVIMNHIFNWKSEMLISKFKIDQKL